MTSPVGPTEYAVASDHRGYKVGMASPAGPVECGAAVDQMAMVRWA
ncbi:hypothetical protein [Sphaerisporangium perillae]|nr:hypothetical protein [Sphaerisporangium perillae]